MPQNVEHSPAKFAQVDAGFSIPTQWMSVGGSASGNPTKLAYRDSLVSESDPPSAKQPESVTILCVHGNPTWSYYYRGVFQHFADRHRVIAVDHVGCGESEKPSQKQYRYTLAQHQQNLIKLVETLDLNRVVLLAHDWGGAIGLGTVAALRERFAGIMLLNTAAFPPPYLPTRISACRIPVLGSIGVRGMNLFARLAITMAMSRRAMDREVAAQLLKPYNSWANRVAIDAFVRDIPLQPKHPTFRTLEDLEAALPGLADLPSLLVWGMKDWCFRPECLRRFELVWPQATSVEIADAGHYVIEDAPQETFSAIDQFLNRYDAINA